MSRYSLHTVTLPILIKAEKGDKTDGLGTLLPAPDQVSFTDLHVVTSGDVWKRLDKWKRSQPNLRRLCGGISLMRRAYEARDEVKLRQALESVWKFVPTIMPGSVITKEPLKTEQNWRWVNWIYSRLMSNLLQSSRFIFLYTVKDENQALMPGLYCPDWQTAAFAFFGADLIRECPKCHEMFIPKSEKTYYCKPAHGVAYRTARSRWRKKQGMNKNKAKSLR
jgi:hypothetical protein